MNEMVFTNINSWLEIPQVQIGLLHLEIDSEGR
jgi:hypothetical protein